MAMNIKNLTALLLVLFSITACEKNPDMSEMDGDFTVYTQYDPDFKFSEASTFYLADSILVAGQGLKNEYWKNENAQELISQVESEMEQRGYTRCMEKDSANVGIQMTYIENDVNMTTFVGSYWDGWWNPGYWGPYWGGGWYMSYPVSYQYTTGAIVMEMVNLSNVDKTKASSTNRLPIVWHANSEGMLSYNSRVNMALIQRAIEQSFRQSPYISK